MIRAMLARLRGRQDDEDFQSAHLHVPVRLTIHAGGTVERATLIGVCLIPGEAGEDGRIEFHFAWRPSITLTPERLTMRWGEAEGNLTVPGLPEGLTVPAHRPVRFTVALAIAMPRGSESLTQTAHNWEREA